MQVRAIGQESTIFREAEVLLTITNSALSARGSLEIGAKGTKAVLNRLSLTNHGEAVLDLESPTKVSLNGEVGGTNGWLAQVESFPWGGSGGKIQVQGALHWRQAGDVHRSIERLRSDPEEFFVPLPNAEIRNPNVSAG